MRCLLLYNLLVYLMAKSIIQIIMSIRRPFNNIRKIEKKENNENGQENKDQFKIQTNPERQSNNNVRPLALNHEKRKINIIGKTPIPPKDQSKEKQQKPITYAPKLNPFKIKKQGVKLASNTLARESLDIQAKEQQSSSQVSKPTPLVLKKKFRTDLKNKSRERQQVLIEEESISNRLQGEESQSFNAEQSTSLKRRPELSIKRKAQRHQVISERPNLNEIQEESYSSPKYEQKDTSEAYVALPVQYRQVNIQPAINISEGRIEKQNKRTSDLKNLLNLEMDLYEQTISLGSVTPYETYINKIKSGFLKNSNDQSFDDKTQNYCQTSSFQYADFTNQCPQDYSVDISRIEKIDSNTLFNDFIMRIAPIIQELIKPNNSVTEPPIFLLAFRPVFKKFLKCPYPIFIYRSEEFKIDLIVIGQKLYIAEGEIESVLMIGKNMIGGLKNGHLVLWNGDNNKSTRLYQTLKEYTQTTNFQLPSYSTHQIDRFSSYSTEFSIVDMVHLQRSSFLSLDSTGKIVKWNVQQEMNNRQFLRPLSVTQVKSLTHHWSLEAYSIKLRAQSYYINTSIGIICLQNQQIKQKLEINNIKITSLQVPKKSPLVFAVNNNNSLLIYNELYSHSLFEMHLNIGNESIKEIIIPEIEHQNRQILYLSILYLIDTAGKIYQLKILENKVEFLKQMGSQEHDERQDKNVIFKGVNLNGQSLQTIKLMRDLKITTSFVRMGIITEKTIPNIKSIIEKNREIMTMLEGEAIMIF